MSKIKDARGRTDGNSGYTRVIGNEALGRLLSRVQATVISNGNELERLIVERSNMIDNLDSFIARATIGEIDNGVYLCLKKTFKKSDRYAPPLKGIEPDMLIFIIESHRICKIIELKDGDAFDTKKSQGEKEHLERFSMQFGAKIPFVTDYYICSFNQEDKDVILSGFKGVFSKEHIMTGRELCTLLGIDYEYIRELRRRDMEDNLDYFLSELLAIEEIRDIIQNKINK